MEIKTDYPCSIAEAKGILTKRETEILHLIAEGFKNCVIANKLYISARTVDTHKTNLIKKLNLECASELTCFAVAFVNELNAILDS
ncbi:MAG: LuxR C-terminal-related transcriptional regulator [Ignavibacteria bacterium]|nr:LuxR C-terminal-related transcriptional regulator [Ignavibacteria bacterium]